MYCLLYWQEIQHIFLFLFLQRWLCFAPTLTISGWVHSALVNILSCCTHQLTLPVGGRVASRGEACVYSFLFVCMCMWRPLRWCILFWSQLFFQSYLPQFVLYLCVCVDYVMFFCHFYSLFGEWLSEGYFSGKYVKKRTEETAEEKKKRKTNHRASWLMPFCLRMLYISTVLSSLFFFLTSVSFSLPWRLCLWYDCNTEVGTMVWSCVVTCLPRECVCSLKLFPLFSRILLDI